MYIDPGRRLLFIQGKFITILELWLEELGLLYEGETGAATTIGTTIGVIDGRDVKYISVNHIHIYLLMI